jgi:hypothetical protein
MQKNKNLLYFGLVFLIILLIFLFSRSLWSGNKTLNQNNESNSLARLELSEKFGDLGEMKVNEEKYYDFKIKNIGSENLKIYQIGTSCNCTFAKLLTNGEESPEFNMPMHNSIALMRWSKEIPSGGEAILRVIYRPSIMPVFGQVERSVVFKTNDPQNQKVEVGIRAFVTK